MILKSDFSTLIKGGTEKLRKIFIETELIVALISMFFLSINDINSIKFDILSNI